MQTREELIGRMQYLYRGLVSIENLTDFKSNTLAQVDQLQHEINFEADRRSRGIKNSQIDVGRRKNRATSVAAIISGIICGFVFLISLGLGALLVAMDPEDEIMRRATAGLSIFIFIVGALITISIALAARGISEGVNNNIVKKSAAAIPDAENKIAAYQSQIDSYVETLYDTDSKIAISFLYIEDLVKEFPPDYCYSYAVGKFISYLQNLRADSLKEAVNLFEDEEYKNRMMAEQRRQTEYAKISAAANLQTAYNTGVIANYSRQIAANTADIAESNRMIEANTKASAEYTRAAAAYAQQNAQYTQDIRNRICPSFWD